MANNVEKLLKLNKKALQGLHYVKGYDFTKPFDVVSGNGSFTLNKIKKECATFGIELENVVATLLIKHGKNATFHRELHIVDIPDFTKFQIYESNKDVKSWKFNFDLYYGVGNFEAHRKNMTETWFVVIQNKDYLVKDHNEKSVDYTGKLKATKPYTRWSNMNGTQGGFSQGYFKQDNAVFHIDSKFGVTIDEPLDKSGYWIPYWKSELNQRLRAYKANKRKNEADSYMVTSDITKEVEEIKANVNVLKHTLADMILNDQYKIVDKVMWRYRSVCDDLKSFEKKLAEKKYNSVSSIRYDIDFIKKYYNEVIDTINANQTEAC
jgi:hypothetical protein